MPFDFGAAITSAVYNPATLEVTMNGSGFGENLYPVSAMSLTKGAATYAITITAWSDTQAVGDLASTLPEGNFTANLTTSDDVDITLANAIKRSSSIGGLTPALVVGVELLV